MSNYPDLRERHSLLQVSLKGGPGNLDQKEEKHFSAAMHHPEAWGGQAGKPAHGACVAGGLVHYQARRQETRRG